MEYYTLLQLKGEPFSNSPDPDAYFQSRQHHACLQNLELAVRMKRGLNVVIGDVGTGKTTTCRELIRKFAQEPEIETHLLLDPDLPSAEDFLRLFYTMICQRQPVEGASEIAIKEQLKQTLFQKGVDENKTVVLIIDEGQKISSSCVEAVRELLNYETNNFKLLQIIIFAQSEFELILKQHANFADRVNLLHRLGPMDYADTRRMIHHRLKQASRTAKPRDMFTRPALWAIYRASGGYPRKIVHLCHQSMLTLIIQNRTRAGWRIVRSCRKRMAVQQRHRRGVWAMAAIAMAVLAGAAYFFYTQNTTIAAFFYAPKAAIEMNNAGASIEQPQAPVAKTPPSGPKPLEAPPAPLEVDTTPQEQKPLSRNDEPPSAGSVPYSQTSSPVAVALVPSPEMPPNPPLLDETLPPEPKAAMTEADHAAVKHPPPAMLGNLSVQPGDTFLGLIRLVYGTNDIPHLQAVAEANPHIVNPGVIGLHDIISFPALAVMSGNAPADDFRAVLNRPPTLAAARSYMETLNRTHNLAIRLVSFWTPRNALGFAVVSSPHFEKPEDAQWWINHRLPPELKTQAQIQKGWPENAVLYSMLPMNTD